MTTGELPAWVRGRDGAALSGDALAPFAAEVSWALAGNLNLERTMRRTIALAVPRLAGWARIALHTERGWRTVAHGSPEHGRTRDLPPPPEGAGLRTLELQAHGETLGRLDLAEVRAGAEQAATELARRAAVALAAARVYEERAELATTLQAALLPPDLPVVPGVRVGARYRPAYAATEIGGDFYDLYPCRGGWSFALGDVCGKGIEAAVATGQARHALRTAALTDADPAAALALLNAAMLLSDGTRFLTVLHGRFTVSHGRLDLELAGGGHPRPLRLRADGTVEQIDTGGTIVGMLEAARFRTTRLTLAAGETLLLYTDGVTEARRRGEQLGSKRLADILADSVAMPAQAITERIEQTVRDWIGASGAADDLALLALQPEPGPRLEVVR